MRNRYGNSWFNDPALRWRENGVGDYMDPQTGIYYRDLPGMAQAARDDEGLQNRDANPDDKPTCCVECHFALEERALRPYLPRAVMSRLLTEHRDLIAKGLPMDQVAEHAQREMRWFREVGVPQWLIHQLEVDHEAAEAGEMVPQRKRRTPCKDRDACAACQNIRASNPSYSAQRRSALLAARARSRQAKRLALKARRTNSGSHNNRSY